MSQNTSKKELKSIKPEDYRRSFTNALCGDCKYADVPRNRKPCCSCSYLERECYFEEADNALQNQFGRTRETLLCNIRNLVNRRAL